jgi:16S rRNA (cytosine967-C5)-methyltransferase
MEKRLLSLAATIIQHSSREHPADAVLRKHLKAQRALSQIQSTMVSRAVFAYFRWFGWLDQRPPLHDQIDHALQLGRKFFKDPRQFPDSDLQSRAVPQWLNDEMEVTSDWLRAIQSEPKVWLRARPGQGGALAAKLGDCEPFGPRALSDTLEYRGKEDLFRTAEFHAGKFELQDISSQAVGLTCAPQPGQTVWDACAGEGGKTLHLSDLMQNKGLIWASDRAEWRLQILKRRAARAGVFNYRAKIWNGGPKLPTKTLFDIVLVDAPCSGIGTWQRNPHARWTTIWEDVRELAQLQIRLLTHAASAVKPGGKLIYSACTLARAETSELVKAFSGPDFKPLPIANPLTGTSTPSSEISLLPEQFGGNGMFIAAWTRTEASSENKKRPSLAD